MQLSNSSTKLLIAEIDYMIEKLEAANKADRAKLDKLNTEAQLDSFDAFMKAQGK